MQHHLIGCSWHIQPPITDHSAAAEMTRCTTLVPTLSVLPIFRMPIPLARSSRISALRFRRRADEA